ncbi:hypothetical protein WN943_025253 [Citrus x changshan-huyou]
MALFLRGFIGVAIAWSWRPLTLILACELLLIEIMLPIQLHIIYKGKNHCKGLIEPDECSLLQLKNEVKDKSYYPTRRFIIDLVSRSCDCGHWELSGLPCAHAMAAISHARHTTEEYLPKYFTKQAYLNTYSVMFKPIPDKVTWDPCDRPKLSLPEITKKIERPKKSRKRAATEPVKKNRSFYVCYSFCGGMNHNVRKCTLRPSIAGQIRAQNQGLSGSGESSNAENTSKRRKRMAVSSPNERFTHSRGRGGNRGQGSRVRGGD